MTPIRVLLVDDCRDSADSLAEMVELFGYEVRAVYSGPATLEIAPAFDPDIVVCDLAMPFMDGFTLCIRLREDPRFARCRFIALSGYGDTATLKRSRDAGFHLHLLKPVSPAELERHLQEASHQARRLDTSGSWENSRPAFDRRPDPVPTPAHGRP